MVTANCGLSEVLNTTQCSKVTQCVQQLKPDEQIATLISCLEVSGRLSPFQVQLLNDLIIVGDRLNQEFMLFCYAKRKTSLTFGYYLIKIEC